jgi:hypothetical protein
MTAALVSANIKPVASPVVSYFGFAALVAAHDFHDDAGDHEGDDEKDGVEGYAHYVHRGYWSFLVYRFD